MTDEREEEEDPVFMSKKKKRLTWETLSEEQRRIVDDLESISKIDGMPKDFLKYDPEKVDKISDRTNFNMKIKPKFKKLIYIGFISLIIFGLYYFMSPYQNL